MSQHAVGAAFLHVEVLGRVPPAAVATLRPACVTTFAQSALSTMKPHVVRLILADDEVAVGVVRPVMVDVVNDCASGKRFPERIRGYENVLIHAPAVVGVWMPVDLH